MDAFGITMHGDNLKRLNGIKNVMEHLAKASPEQVPAGERALSTAASSSKIASFLKMIKEGGTDFIFDNPRGKQFLFNAGNMKPGSSSMVQFMDAQLPKILAIAATPTTKTPVPTALKQSLDK